MRITTLAALIAVGLSTGAGASTLLSENFNATVFRGAFLQNGPTDRFGTSALYYGASANGWTFADGSGGGFPHVVLATTLDGTDGSVWLQEIGSSASHALTGLIVGKKYTVSFLQSGDDVQFASWNYNVAIDGGTIYAGSGTTQSSGENPTRQFITTTFTATNSSAVLSFADATTNSNANVVIDNVSVTAVPEPATWAMMIAGFAMVSAAARRRRSTVTA